MYRRTTRSLIVRCQPLWLVRSTLGTWLRARRRQRELSRAQRFRVGPLWVLIEPGHQTDQVIARLGAALDVLARTDSIRFKRFRRGVCAIYVRAGAGAEYWRDGSVCVLSASKLAAEPHYETALDMVHEATHAAVHHRGIAWGPASVERIEKLCLEQEIAFCKALAELGYDVRERVAWYRERLKHPLYTPELLLDRMLRDRSARREHWDSGVERPGGPNQ